MKSIDAWENSFKKDIMNQGFSRFLKKEISSFLKYLSKKSRILDLGCGIGDKANYIGEKGFDVLGIDSSSEAIKYAKGNFKGVLFKKANLLNLKISEKFDAITSIAFHHCLKDKERKILNNKIDKILAPKSYIFLLVLSSKDSTLDKSNEMEKNTFVQKSRKSFHLFTRKELIGEFKDYKTIKLKEHIRKIKGKTNAIFIGIFQK